MEMRSSFRKHRSIAAWARATVADAAQELTNRRAVEQNPPHGLIDTFGVFRPGFGERAACCDRVKNDENLTLHVRTFSHCYTLLASALREGRFNAPTLGTFWREHIEAALPDLETRNALTAAINLGALAVRSTR